MSALDVEALSPGTFQWTEFVQKLRDKGPQMRQTRHLRQDGSSFPVEVRLEYMGIDAGYLMATTVDTTERRAQETNLERSADLLRVVKMLPDVIFRCEKAKDGRIYWTLNEGRLAEEFHLTTEEIKGKPLEALFPPPVAERLREEFERGFRGDPREFVNEMNGRHFKHYPQAVLGPNGKVVALVGFISEVTSLVKAEQQIRGLNDQLAKKVDELALANHELESFGYSVSHDLRGPLGVIDTAVYLIREHEAARLGSASLDHLTRVAGASKRMNQLIEDILHLSHVSRADLKRAPTDVSGLARTILLELQRQDTARHVEVTVADGLAAEADPGLLRVALENLLRNAWKFTGKATTPKIEVGSRDVKGRRTFYVHDNGVGFDMGHADRLFKPFQRLVDAKDFEGTGVGLALVKRVVERHGGTVWAESRPGEGATFLFTL